METFELKASNRTTSGKGAARGLRREGMIPAILYGPETETIPLSVHARDLQNIFQSSSSENVILKLVIDKGKSAPKTAMVKELQIVPVTEEYLHVDFYEVSMDKAIRVEVPVVLTGKAKGSEKGGLVQLIRKELEVSCLPKDIPEAIEIDITDLDIGDSIHLEDIPANKKIKMIADTNFTVVTILAPTVEAVEEGEGVEAVEQEEEAAPEEGTER